MRLNCSSENMDVKKDIWNDLLKRQELVAELESEKSPSFEEIRNLVAEKSGKPEENVEVRAVKGSFGKRVFVIDAYIYDSKEDLDNMKKLEMTSKERKEGEKPVEEKVGGSGGEASEVKEDDFTTPKSNDVITDNLKQDERSESGSEVSSDSEAGEVSEVEETPAESEGEVPVEERPEEEKKEEKEEEVKEEESKEA